MNQVTAKASRNYQWRPALIGAACLIWGVLCVRDGYFKYPLQKEQHETYMTFREAHPDTWTDRWATYAAENDLPSDPTTIVDRSNTDIYAQWAMLLIVLPIGLVGAYKFFDSFRWSVTADEEGLQAHGGHRASWAQLTGLDKTRWDRKGIAYVHYKDDAGRQRRILLDDWKFEREPTDKILALVEAHRPDLVGGETAPQPAEDENPASASV